jgi:hypothetical protein
MTAAAAGGFFAGYAATGTLKSAVIGAFSAAITAGIAGSGMSGYEQMAAQAVTGGVVESLQGGSFGHGFVAAGLTTYFMPQVGGYSAPVRTALGALIGGTISAVTGGKFANGAISGAVQGAMAGSATVKRASPSPGRGTSGNFEDAPDHLKALLGNPKTRQIALRKIADLEFPLMDQDKIFYQHKIGYYKGKMVDGLTDPDGTVNIFMTALSNNYEVLVSVLQHEYAHVLQFKFGVDEDADDGVFDEMRAYRSQMESDRFPRLPIWYQDGVKALYNDALRQHRYNTGGICKSVETCE